MKKTLVKSLAMAFAGSLLLAGSAMALPHVSGEVNLTGVWQPSTVTAGVWSPSTLLAATAVDFTGTTTVNLATGDFLPIDGAVATMQDFEFNPALVPSPVNPLWSAGTFAFEMTSVNIETQTANDLTLTGNGLIHADGFDTTIGTWRFTTQDSNGVGTTRLTWSSNQVPEPSTMLLLGTGLVGLAGISRRKKVA